MQYGAASKTLRVLGYPISVSAGRINQRIFVIEINSSISASKYFGFGTHTVGPKGAQSDSSDVLQDQVLTVFARIFAHPSTMETRK